MENYKYKAFISYRHTKPDSDIAEAIHRMIETFKVPKGVDPGKASTPFRVFRDREELAARNLTDSIEEALRTSEYLIVICSKRTPLSEWCAHEIQTFRQLHGDDKVVPVLIEGEPFESFPEPLKDLKWKRSDEEEEIIQDVLAAELRPASVQAKDFPGYETLEREDPQALTAYTKEALALLKTEKYRIMAGLLKCNYGDLKQRDKERRMRLVMVVSALLSALFLVFGIFMFNAYTQAEAARREAVQNSASVLMKSAADMSNAGDRIKAILVAEEAMKDITADMESYKDLRARTNAVFSNPLYSSGAALSTVLNTRNIFTFFNLSPDGSSVAAGTGADSVGLYDSKTGELLHRIPGHQQQVKLVSFSPDGKYLVSTGFDSRTLVHDLSTLELVKEIPFSGTVMASQFVMNGEYLCLAFQDAISSSFYWVRSEDWSVAHSITETQGLSSIRFSNQRPEILMIYSSELGGQNLTRIDATNGQILRSYGPIELPPSDSTYMPEFQDLRFLQAHYVDDEKAILGLIEDNIIKMDAQTGEVLYMTKGEYNHENPPFIIAQEQNLFFTLGTSEVNRHNLENGELEESIFLRGGILKAMAYEKTTNTLAVSHDSGRISLWQDGVITDSEFDFGGGVPQEMEFLPDGSALLASDHMKAQIRILDLLPKNTIQSIHAQFIASSQDRSKRLYYDGFAFLLDDGFPGESPLHKLNLPSDRWAASVRDAQNFRISNDGKWIVLNDSGYSEELGKNINRLKVYDVEKDSLENIDLTDFEPVYQITPDSKQLLIAETGVPARLIDLDTKAVVRELEGVTGSGDHMGFSVDGKSFYLNRLSGSAQLYDFETGMEIGLFPGEILHSEGDPQNIRLIYLDNETLYKQRGEGITETVELDFVSADAAMSFQDLTLFDPLNEHLFVIRNGGDRAHCYLFDGESGHLLKAFHPTVTSYEVQGFFSQDGNAIGMDEYFNTSPIDPLDDSIDAEYSYMSGTTVYRLLDENALIEQARQLTGGRTLTQEERGELGLTKQ
ncbi:MAG: TIR domain-containing protein [Tissierellia bacterium]|nr:TIR domain-containing protein [Tissierellia bacterium]